ncbi:MAG TPA: hypothetical protein V6D14_09880 [Coleofasciculaceae cyanobacterium]
MSKRLPLLLLLFVLTLAIACCSNPQLRSAQAQSSAYSYLAKVADRVPLDTKPLGVTNVVENTGKDELSFLVSFETTASNTDFERTMGNVAFTYDNAVAALAFIATGDQQRAKRIMDALLYAQNHDRFYKDGRIRNSYRAGKLVAPDGRALLPGWYDTKEGRWAEDEFQVSTHTGNVAWAILALLGYYETYGGEPYLAAALRMGEWIERNCRDSRGAGGYIGGFSGWEQNPKLLSYKATEHNLDLYAAFQRLYLITGNSAWQERATSAQKLVLAMWDDKEGKFWTGTKLDGVTVNQDTIPLDVQAWAPLALREEGKPYWRSLDYAQKQHRVGDGFDFNQDRDRIWYEGTAQMAVAYHYTGQLDKSKALISTLLTAQDATGGIPAGNQDGLTTGFSLPTGEPWFYFRRLHVGATAWMVLAQKGVNPFWLGRQ